MPLATTLKAVAAAVLVGHINAVAVRALRRDEYPSEWAALDEVPKCRAPAAAPDFDDVALLHLRCRAAGMGDRRRRRAQAGTRDDGVCRHDRRHDVRVALHAGLLCDLPLACRPRLEGKGRLGSAVAAGRSGFVISSSRVASSARRHWSASRVSCNDRTNRHSHDPSTYIGHARTALSADPGVGHPLHGLRMPWSTMQVFAAKSRLVCMSWFVLG